MTKGTWSFTGIHVFPNAAIPEFVPILRMRECGCSQQVLDEFNQYLLDRFGKRRHFVKIKDDLYCHPNTFKWFKEQCRD